MWAILDSRAYLSYEEIHGNSANDNGLLVTYSSAWAQCRDASIDLEKYDWSKLYVTKRAEASIPTILDLYSACSAWCAYSNSTSEYI
jgi:hypothetical protein